MALSLYEINEQILNFRFEIDEETGEILNFDELDRLNVERDEKIESMCLWVKNLRAEASAIKAEEENLAGRRKALTRKADRFEDYIAGNLGGKPFKTPRVACSFRKSTSVEILDESKIPPKYLNISTVSKPVKADIAKYLKGIEGSDEKCEWAKLVEHNNMSIK